MTMTQIDEELSEFNRRLVQILKANI